MDQDEENNTRIPIVEEQVVVDKVAAVSDRLQVSTTVETREVIVEDTLQRGHLSIHRTPLDREVAEAPAPREEGDLLVISVVEERLVKRLFVVEEVRIQQTTSRDSVSLPTTLRFMRATVEHPEEPASGGRLKWQI